ncbi:hypothetical protein [Bremerella cremea]|uniref:hypothetical protein n=1 Tax=Bremerella cremea TaxID=1031537 RepID=UPI0031ECBB34
MIVKLNGVQIDTESICYALMYRCTHCAGIVQGSKDILGHVNCEKCGCHLEEDDEVAYRLDGED